MRATQQRELSSAPPRARPQRGLPSPTPSSSSGASGSSSSSGGRSSGSVSARMPLPPRSLSVSPMSSALDDDGDLWASIRLASSPPTASATRLSMHAQARSSHGYNVMRPKASMDDEEDPMLSLVIDDFSQDRMGHVPTVKSRPPLMSSQPKASSWSQRRPKPDPPLAMPGPHTIARAVSLEDSVNADGDITHMDHRVFVSRDQWVDHRTRRACVVCDREFGMLRKKHSCRMCGDVVCSRCSLFKNVRLPGVVGESKARVCSRCFLQYRQRVFHKSLSADDIVLDNVLRPEDSESPRAEDDGDFDDDVLSGTYDCSEELPSAEDVMRRTAAKVSGTRAPAAAVTPIDFGAHAHRYHKPVSLLAPELMHSMYRESATLAAAALNDQNHIYGREPSMELLSPASSYNLLDMRIFDADHTQSFSSTVSTVSSSVSMSSIASSSSSRSATEEELAAAIKARELEKEVQESRQRIQELESKMQEQENKKTELSLEQQRQLSEARELIAQLQAQLKQQEQNARDAAITRDSICLTNMRQQQVQPLVGSEQSMPGSRKLRSNSIEAESEALRQKLRLLERQLQHAGINVAEVIPYTVAKQRIIEISRRMAEISEAEATMKQQNPKGVAALRREYYVLEQDMERFHTALLMSDEYIEEQAAKERDWEATHAAENVIALRRVRSALPVDISRLSEQALRTMMTPSGKYMAADLARRFKRTNVLQLLRLPPGTVMRMHPSVIENYRTAGLTLIERRALHEALKEPASEWQKQSRDENAQRKAVWFKKLKDAFVQALLGFEMHVVKHHRGEANQCPFIGKMCVVRAEEAVTLLYSAQLGFPEDDVYYQPEIIKSDPDGACEKALNEAKSQAQISTVTAARQSELKTHYGARNIRLVTMALATMEEMDAAMDRLRELDSKAGTLVLKLQVEDVQLDRWWRICEEIVSEMRELTSQLARRAGICLSGKRDHRKDSADTRSQVEAKSSHAALTFVDNMIEDILFTISLFPVPASFNQLKNSMPRIRELVFDVQSKNNVLLCSSEPSVRTLDTVVEADSEDDSSEAGENKIGAQARTLTAGRVPWRKRQQARSDSLMPQKQEPSEITDLLSIGSLKSSPCSPPIPRASILLDAIRTKRSVCPDASTKTSHDKAPSFSEPLGIPGNKLELDSRAQVERIPKANDLLAAIRAKRNGYATGSAESEVDTSAQPEAIVTSPPVTTADSAVVGQVRMDEAPKANDLLAAIRARKAKLGALSGAASVGHVISSA